MQVSLDIVTPLQKKEETTNVFDVEENLENLSTIEGSKAKRESLEKIFTEFRAIENSSKKASIWINAKILLAYADTLYGENYEHCREFILGALTSLHQGKDVLSDFKTLSDSREFLKSIPLFFKSIEDEIKKWSTSSSEHILKESNTEQKLVFSALLQKLLYSLQNIDSYADLPYQKNDIFEVLFANLEAIYRSILDEPKAKTEFIELIYNSRPFIFLREHENDTDKYEKACVIYDTVLELDSSDSMKARVANIRGCWMRRANQPEKAKAFFDEAIKLQDSIPDFNQFVRANTYNNRASTELVCKDPDLQVAKKYIDVALAYSKQKREEKEDNDYFASYDMVAAKIELKNDEFEKARAFCKIARETVNTYPESNEDDLRKLDELEKQISEREQELKEKEIQ